MSINENELERILNCLEKSKSSERELSEISTHLPDIYAQYVQGKQLDGIQPIVSHLYRAVSESFIMPLMRHCFRR